MVIALFRANDTVPEPGLYASYAVDTVTFGTFDGIQSHHCADRTQEEIAFLLIFLFANDIFVTKMSSRVVVKRIKGSKLVL